MLSGDQTAPSLPAGTSSPRSGEGRPRSEHGFPAVTGGEYLTVFQPGSIRGEIMRLAPFLGVKIHQCLVDANESVLINFISPLTLADATGSPSPVGHDPAGPIAAPRRSLSQD